MTPTLLGWTLFYIVQSDRKLVNDCAESCLCKIMCSRLFNSVWDSKRQKCDIWVQNETFEVILYLKNTNDSNVYKEGVLEILGISGLGIFPWKNFWDFGNNTFPELNEKPASIFSIGKSIVLGTLEAAIFPIYISSNQLLPPPLLHVGMTSM